MQVFFYQMQIGCHSPSLQWIFLSNHSLHQYFLWWQSFSPPQYSDWTDIGTIHSLPHNDLTESRVVTFILSPPHFVVEREWMWQGPNIETNRQKNPWKQHNSAPNTPVTSHPRQCTKPQFQMSGVAQRVGARQSVCTLRARLLLLPSSHCPEVDSRQTTKYEIFKF